MYIYTITYQPLAVTMETCVSLSPTHPIQQTPIPNDYPQTVEITPYDIDKYFDHIEQRIYQILSRPAKETLTYDILDTDKTIQYKRIVLKEKQRQMKIGEIWQEVIGDYDGYINLRVGDKSGLDIVSHKYKIAIELKNRTNTDNASSRKANLDKLAKFKKEHPDYTCMYANINEDTEEKTISGTMKEIIHDDTVVVYATGYAFLRHIFKEETDRIIYFVKKTIEKYIL